MGSVTIQIDEKAVCDYVRQECMLTMLDEANRLLRNLQITEVTANKPSLAARNDSGKEVRVVCDTNLYGPDEHLAFIRLAAAKILNALDSESGGASWAA